MPVRRIVRDTGGLIANEVIEYDRDEELPAAEREAVKVRDIGEELSAVERAAHAVLKAYGIAGVVHGWTEVDGVNYPALVFDRETPPELRDAAVAFATVKLLRVDVAKVRSKATRSLLQRAFTLGRLSRTLETRPFEEPAKLGRESLKRWRGQWVRVTDLERDILNVVGDRTEVPLRELLAAVWSDRVQWRNRSGQLPTEKVRKALSQLNSKLSELRLPTLSLRRETVVVE